MKFCQILVCCMTNISNVLLAQCWRLGSTSFYDFIKEIIFNSWHLPFYMSLIHFFKKMKHWNLHIINYWVLEQVVKLKTTWNLAPVFPTAQKIPENYCPCLYLSISQVWWLSELWFKRYIQKCALSYVLILIMT